LPGFLLSSPPDVGTALRDLAENLDLHEQGTSFRHELEDVRYELARQLLTDSKMSISKIASTLKHANLSGFNRAFKRWAGITPGEWRTRYATDR